MDNRDAWLNGAMERYEASLLRMCFAWLRDLQLAEDAVQETFLKAYRKYDTFRSGSSEKTWLISIAANTCRDILRSSWFRHIDRSVALDSLPEPEVPFTETDDALTNAVMKLRPRLREVILLCYYQELSAQEAAAVLGTSRQTVYNRLSRALAELRKRLEVDSYEAR